MKKIVSVGQFQIGVNSRDAIIEYFEDLALMKDRQALERHQERFEITKKELKNNDFFVLQVACFHNQVEIFKWLTTAFEITRTDIRRHQNLFLRKATQYGHVTMVDCLITDFKLHKKDILGGPTSAFSNALLNGDLTLLNYFFDTCSITRHDIKDHIPIYLEMAFQSSDVNSTLWLKEKFSLTTRDVQQNNNALLRTLAFANDACALQRLQRTFSLSAIDARSESNEALFRASEMGYSSVLECLYNDYGLTLDDARSIQNYPFRISAENGHLNNLIILKTRYGLSPSDARSERNYALRMAAHNEHIQVLTFLKNEFGLTANDAMDSGNEAVKTAVASGNLRMLNILAELFDIKIPKSKWEKAEKLCFINALEADNNESFFEEENAIAREYVSIFLKKKDEGFQALEDTLGLLNDESTPQRHAVAFWHILLNLTETWSKNDEVGQFLSTAITAFKEKKMAFDLHGLRLKSAKSFTLFLLAFLKKHPQFCTKNSISLIVGKGLHSKKKPVLATHLPIMLDALKLGNTVDDGTLVITLQTLDTLSWHMIQSIDL